ncbi:MAG TPA: OmpA family protein [Geobacteraceae bacterium]
MMTRWCRLLSLSLCLLTAVLLAGCAGQKDLAAEKSVVVLLPEDGKVSGEVTVVTPHGSQLLNQSWQAAEIGRGDAPTLVLDEAKMQGIFGEVLSTMPLPPAHYVLFFKLDSVELVPSSQLLLPEILKAVNDRKPAGLSVVGHTDTVESAQYNYRLGLQRANAVAAQLRALGAAPATVETSSRGKTDLLVQTPDQTFEPRNRRAEVTIR